MSVDHGTKGHVGQMSGTPAIIEWFIARDGAQHGPISDAEMRKFVELGHLRATDLVWCPRFTEWCSGAQAFPEHFSPKPAAQAAAPVARGAGVLAPQIKPIAAAQGAAAAPVPQAAQSSLSEQDAAWAEAMRASVAVPASGPVPAGQPAQLNAQSPVRFAPAPHDASTSAPSPAAAASEPVAIPADEVDEQAPAPRRSWIGVATVALAVLLIAAGTAWIAWQNRSLVTDASAIGTVLTSATGSKSAGPDETFLVPPYAAPGENKQQIDAALQRIAVWRYLKKEFGDWYQEIVAEVERMRVQQKQSEGAITQYLVNVIVTLRRRNALTALQSSPDRLKDMASAFVGNLKQLGSRDGATCYAFITHGESSPFMIELSRASAFSETLQKQMIAVFSSIVDARSARRIHPNTRRQDYDVLTEDLTKNRGWSQVDLATFSDPQKLATTPPDRVCALVQDWFLAQLALKDPELQTRLLAESLKPLVGG